MSDTTGTLPESAALMAALERRIGHKVGTTRDLLAYAREHGTTADAIVAQAERDAAGEWCPSWCSHEDNCLIGSGMADRIHLSEPATFHRAVGARATRDEGEAFQADVRMWLHHDAGEHADMDDWALTAQVKIRSDQAPGEVDINMSPDRMRDLADFLFVAADEIDAWREQHAAEEVAGHE